MGETELSSVEGQRVMQVLDETLNATRLISCVTPDLRSRSANITDMVGPEVTDLLLAHVDLLEEYEGALAKCGGEPKSNDMVDVTLRLQDSVRTLSRLPGRYPGLVDKLMVMAMDTDMQRVVTRGVHTLEGLKHITFQKLITSVEEENSRQNFISGIERKEQQKQKERKDLETRLTAEKESRQKEVKRLTDQRDKLQDEIEEINTTNAEEVAKLENGTKEQEEQHTKEHNAQVESLEKECEKLRTELAEMVESNTTDEADLRGKKGSFYSQVTKCIEEYDTVMTEKKAQHERRQKMHEDDLQQIQEYEEYFAQLAIEEAERAEQERIAAEARAEEERAQKVIHDAAAKIQALYRGFRERQELANPKGKGKGKGKKKK